MRSKNLDIGCLWVDEFNATTKTIKGYQKQHDSFIDERIKELAKEKPKRKVNIVDCDANLDNYFDAIKSEIFIKHKDNNNVFFLGVFNNIFF
jgi:nitrogen regulatory protein PII